MRLLLFLAVCAACLAQADELFCDFEQSSSGWEAHGGSQCALSTRHHKEGAQSLRWSWQKPGAGLHYTFPRQTTGCSRQLASHFGLWLYAERPVSGRLYLDLCRGRDRIATCWFQLEFTGWRVLGLQTELLGLPPSTTYDNAILRPEAGSGELWLDAVAPCFLSAPVRADDRQPWADRPELLHLPAASTARSAHDVSLNRPFLPPLVRAEAIPPAVRAQMKELEKHYLPSPRRSGRKAKGGDFASLQRAFEELGITEKDGVVSGPPLAFGNSGFLTPPNATDFNGRFAPVFLQLAAACHREQGENRARAEAMYVRMCRHLLDQGLQEGNDNFGWIGNGYDFRHYPPAVFSCCDLLRRTGLLEAMAKSTAWLCMGNEMLSERPYSSCDQFYNFSSHLPAAILALPDEAERYQRLRAFQRYLDITVGENPLPFGTDGTAHHHTGHHLSYGGYTPPALLRTQILPLSHTVFRLSRRAQEKLRVYARACAFQTMHNNLAPNLYLRSGTPLPFSAAPVALGLARLGSPDGKSPVDREMAAIYLDSLDRADTPEAREFRAMGIRPSPPTGHMSLNRAATALHRRADWQAAAVGMCREHRGLEIYGWTESNNYGRYSRNGSLFLTHGRETGWRRSGWNWNHWPGATNPVRDNHDLYEGYALYSNANDRAAGTELGGDGAWGNDFHCRDMAFKKSYFFFGNLIAALTSDIQCLDASGCEIVTTLFQQATPPGSAPPLVDRAPAPSPPRQDREAAPIFLTDSFGNIYALPRGTPLHVSRREQEWTYMTRSDLANPADNPCLDIRRKQFRHAPLAANARYYKPTRGVFDLAYISHGPDPRGESARYVICISPQPGEAAVFRRAMRSGHPRIEILRQDQGAHVVRHSDSKTTAYVLFSSEGDLPAPLQSANLPGTVMVRDLGNSYLIAAASGDPHRKEPLRLLFRDGTRAELDPPYPLSATIEVQKARAR